MWHLTCRSQFTIEECGQRRLSKWAKIQALTFYIYIYIYSLVFFLLFHCGPMFPTAQRRQGGKMLGGPRPTCYTGQLKWYQKNTNSLRIERIIDINGPRADYVWFCHVEIFHFQSSIFRIKNFAPQNFMEFLWIWLIWFEDFNLGTSRPIFEMHGLGRQCDTERLVCAVCLEMFGAPAPSSLHSCPPGRVASRFFWWMHGQTLHPGGGDLRKLPSQPTSPWRTPEIRAY